MMNAVLLTILIAQILLSLPVSSYKILLITSTAKSPVFTLAAIAKELTNRGHGVMFFVGDGFLLKETGVKDWTKINVVRYKDSLDGVPMDYDRMFNNITNIVMEQKASFFEVTSIVQER